MSDLPSIPGILEQADIFCELTWQQLAMVASIGTMQEFNAGDVIFEEHSAGQELYVISDGEVDIQINPSVMGEPSEGGPVTITTLRRGQSFGELGLVDMDLRSASAICAQHETHVVVIPREALMDLCHSYPDLGFKLMHSLAVDMAAMIRSNNAQLREWMTWVRGGAAT